MAVLFLFNTLRVGSGSAGHLIHRGAVPLPLEGKDNAPPKMRLDLQWRVVGAIAHLIHR